MPEWLTFLLADTSALQLVFWVVAIIALIGGVVKLWPALSQAVTIVNAVSGLPAFIRRTDETLATQEAVTERLRHQVENDHETNLRDELTEVLEKVGPMAEQIEQLTRSDAAQWREIEDTRPKHSLPKEHS